MSKRHSWYEYSWVLGLVINLVGHFVRLTLSSSIGLVIITSGYLLLLTSYLFLIISSYRKSHKVPLYQITWLSSLLLSPLMFKLANSGKLGFAAFILVSTVLAGLIFQFRYPTI
jgi:hypothetical protein